MASKPPNIGIECEISADGKKVTAILRNEKEESASLICDSDKLRQMVATLLVTADIAARRAGHKPPKTIPKDISQQPLIPSQVVLLSGPSGQPDILCVTVGEVQLGFQFSTKTLRNLGNALIAASAGGSRH